MQRKNKFNTAYQLEIMTRFMNKEQIKKFHEQYIDAFKVATVRRPLTKQDMDILKDYQSGKMFTEICRERGISYGRVQSAINRAILASTNRESRV